jgi:indoleacetamide hydrolase
MNRRDFALAALAVPLAGAAAGPAAAQARRWKGGVLIEMTAGQAVEAMKKGDFTAEAYAQALIARCEAGAYLNAFISFEPDKVLEAARATDRRRKAGGPLGPLHGLPIPVKDSVNTADYPTTAGTRALKGFRPAADAAAVARLKGAGALVLGKTNLHELSLGWTSNNGAFGPVHNPYDPARIPGGSTGGTAAAVAARMAPLGVAEDTQGSIRVPAALCGICGFRPTTGRYPTQGTAPITPLFDQIGPHARAVGDLVLFEQVMTGETRAIAPARLKGLRLGLARDYFFTGIDPQVGEVMEAVIAALKAEGVVFVEAPLPGLAELVAQVTGPVQVHDVGPSLAAWLRQSGAPVTLEQVIDQASPDVKGLLQRFATPGAQTAIPEPVYAAARDVGRPAMQRLLAGWFAEHGVAAMLFPATMVPATPIGEADTVEIAGKRVSFTTAVSRNISPGSTAGLPGLVMPGGLTRDRGLPVGIELDAPAGADRALLAIGLAVQKVLEPIAAPAVGAGLRPTP